MNEPKLIFTTQTREKNVNVLIINLAYKNKLLN